MPTSDDAKFRAKFWIDVVGQRIAKALGSTINNYPRKLQCCHSSEMLYMLSLQAVQLVPLARIVADRSPWLFMHTASRTNISSILVFAAQMKTLAASISKSLRICIFFGESVDTAIWVLQ